MLIGEVAERGRRPFCVDPGGPGGGGGGGTPVELSVEKRLALRRAGRPAVASAVAPPPTYSLNWDHPGYARVRLDDVSSQLVHIGDAADDPGVPGGTGVQLIAVAFRRKEP